MGRMHSGGKGISKSALPYKRSPPSWLKITSAQVEDNVCKLAKKGLTPSQVLIFAIRIFSLIYFILLV
jgi:small subunit ribosomal protein S13e